MKKLNRLLVFLILLIPCSLFAGTGRLKVVDEGIYEIPANREWKEHFVEAGKNDYTGFDLIGEYDPKSKIVIGYFISDTGSTSSCSDHIYGSTDDSTDACYQYVQLSFRVIDDIGYIRIDRVCVNPTNTEKTLTSLIGNKIKWFLLQKSP